MALPSTHCHSKTFRRVSELGVQGDDAEAGGGRQEDSDLPEAIFVPRPGFGRISSALVYLDQI